jgi:hypothetical protein
MCLHIQQIEVDYLSTLLEGQSPDPLSAHRVLDSLLEDKLRLRVCESVLEQRMKDAAAGSLDHVETTIFILHYITSKLGKVVGEKQRMKYMNWLLGAKVGCRLLALRGMQCNLASGGDPTVPVKHTVLEAQGVQ